MIAVLNSPQILISTRLKSIKKVIIVTMCLSSQCAQWQGKVDARSTWVQLSLPGSIVYKFGSGFKFSSRAASFEIVWSVNIRSGKWYIVREKGRASHTVSPIGIQEMLRSSILSVEYSELNQSIRPCQQIEADWKWAIRHASIGFTVRILTLEQNDRASKVADFEKLRPGRDYPCSISVPEENCWSWKRQCFRN